MTTEKPNESDNIITSTEKKIEDVAKQLEVNIPQKFLPFPMRIIILLMLVGGLSILGSAFTDFVAPKEGGFVLYIFRLATGVTFLLVAYGIFKRERWAFWLYGFVVFIGLLFNFAFAFIPALLVIYFYTKRNSFHPCFLDKLCVKIIKEVKEKIK